MNPQNRFILLQEGDTLTANDEVWDASVGRREWEAVAEDYPDMVGYTLTKQDLVHTVYRRSIIEVPYSTYARWRKRAFQCMEESGHEV